jgi:hypothetical protein
MDSSARNRKLLRDVDERMPTQPLRRPRAGGSGVGYGGILARITGAILLDGETAQWRYTWVQVGINADGSFHDKVGGSTSASAGYARCGFEAYNPQQRFGIMGNGVDTNGADYPAGFALVSHRGNPVVFLRPMAADDDPEVIWWIFDAPNANDGTCN